MVDLASFHVMLFCNLVDPSMNGPGTIVPGGPYAIVWTRLRGYSWTRRTGWPETEWTYVILFSSLVDLSMNGTGCKGTGGPADLGGL